MAWLALLLSGCSLATFQSKRLDRAYGRAGLEQRDVQVGDTNVRYWVGGEGEPLVLLHGFGGDAKWSWMNQLALAKNHRLVVPDMVWFGGSHSTRDDFGLELQLDAVRGVMAYEGIERADVAGISYGGFVAFYLAFLHPEQVDRLVIVDSPGPVFTPSDLEESLARFGAGDAADIVIPRDYTGVRTLLELAYEKPPMTPPFLLKDVYQTMFTQQVDEKRKLLAELQTVQPPELWEIRSQTLVIWGENDALFPVDVGRRLTTAIGPHARFVSLPKTRHAPNIEKWKAFNREVEGFLRRAP